MRRLFTLPEGDVDYLSALGLSWETILDQGMNWLLIHQFPVPIGYDCQLVSVALMIPPGYPIAQIDMAYFFPRLVKLNSRPIGATTFQNIDNKTYQRWSRHRTGENPWRPGIDDLSTHLSLVENWLSKELTK